MQQARASLSGMKAQIKRAPSNDLRLFVNPPFDRALIQQAFNDILQTFEQLTDRLRCQQEELKTIHLQMETVCVKVQRALGDLGSGLANDVQASSRKAERSHEELTGDVPMGNAESSVSDYLTEGELLLRSNRYQACLELMTVALAAHPGRKEFVVLAEECRRRWEDQRREEEMVIHIENLKKEAMDQFDKEQFQECVKTFEFLCQLDPEDHSLQEYLKLSREQARQMDGSPGSLVATSLSDTSQVPDLDHLPELQTPETSGAKVDLDSKEHPPEGHIEASVGSLIGSDGPGVSRTLFTSSKKWRLGLLTTSGLWILGIGLYALLNSALHDSGVLLVQSNPPGSTVLINGVAKGQTPLAQSITPGNHDIEIQNDDYVPYLSKIALESDQLKLISVRLETWRPESTAGDPLLEQIQVLQSQRDLLGALQASDVLLKTHAKNRSVLATRRLVRNQLLEDMNEAIRNKRWGEANERIGAFLSVSPGDRAAQSRLKRVSAKLQSGLKTAVNTGSSGDVQWEELQRQILSAIAAANYLPPASGSAWELIQKLKRQFPDSPFAEEKLDLIRVEILKQAQQKARSKELEGAKALLRQLQVYFPDWSETRVLQEDLRSKESNQIGARNFLFRAEAAFSAGHYISPWDESAFFLSHRLLNLDSENQRAQTIIKESVAKALRQAERWIEEENYQEADQAYSTLLQALKTRKHLSLSAQEIQRERQRLEFKAFPVIHDHVLGHCLGTLRFNGYQIVFLPSGASKDGFKRKLSEIDRLESGDKLKVLLSDKNYRFAPSGVGDKGSSRQMVQQMHEMLQKLIQK